MAYTLLVVVALASVAAKGFSLHDSQSYDSLLSSLSAMTDGDAVDQEPGYMDALQRDLEDLAGSSPLSRVSRSAQRNSAEHPVCCGSGKRREFFEEIKSASAGCHPETYEDGGEDGKHFNFTVMCASVQCIAKKMNVVDAEGYLLTAPFVNAVDKLYTEDSLKVLAKELAPDCVTEANAGAKRMMDAPYNENKCNAAPLFVDTCVRLRVILKCPQDLKVESEQCDAIRQYLAEQQNRGRNS